MILLIIMVLLFFNLEAANKITAKSTQPTAIVTHNYQTYNTYNQKTYADVSERYTRDRIKDKDDYYCKTSESYYDKDPDYLRYISNSDHDVKEGIFGEEINQFKVWVENTDYEPGYFAVKFYFTDYSGRTKTETVNHYIRADEEKRFLYTDVLDNKYGYKHWKYKVISKTERYDSLDKDYKDKEVCYYKY